MNKQGKFSFCPTNLNLYAISKFTRYNIIIKVSIIIKVIVLPHKPKRNLLYAFRLTISHHLNGKNGKGFVLYAASIQVT